MRAYFDSLRVVLGRADAVLWPTHGGPVTDPKPFLEAYLSHRLEREAQVLGCIRCGTGTVPAIVAELYTAVRKELHPAAERSVFAHLVKLVDDGVVGCDGPLSATATFSPA
jgi:glyoxylase-like metal-dependent hydrolase (beta-lactamase superfamily II)